ncbi:MAG: TlpA disulfide reductase family protein, partial [Bacteroidota bacterium]
YDLNLESYAYQGTIYQKSLFQAEPIETEVELIAIRRKWDLGMSGPFWLKLGETQYFYRKDTVERWSQGWDSIRLIPVKMLVGESSLGWFPEFALSVPFRNGNEVKIEMARGEILGKSLEFYQGRAHWVVELDGTPNWSKDASTFITRYWIDPYTKWINRIQYVGTTFGNTYETDLQLHRQAINQRSEVQIIGRRALWPDLPRVPYQRSIREPSSRDTVAKQIRSSPAYLAPPLKGMIFGRTDSLELVQESAKLILLDFFFVGCLPCLVSMPYVESLYAEFHAEGLTVWGINSKDTDPKDADRLSHMIEEVGLDYPVLLVDKSVDQSYGVTGYPRMFLLNQNREIIHIVEGYSAQNIRQLRRVVEKALKE